MTYEKLSFPTSSFKPSSDFSSGTISYLVTLNPASSFSVLLTMSLDKLAPSARYENKFSNPKSSPCLSLSPSTPVKYLLSFVPFMAMLASCYTKTTAKETICLSQQGSKKKKNEFQLALRASSSDISLARGHFLFVLVHDFVRG